MVKIPVHIVPRAYVDYDMEQRQILRQDFLLPDGFRVPPLSAGRLMALELVCSDFFLHPDTCTQLDVAAALVLMTCRQSLVEELTACTASASEVASVGESAAGSVASRSVATAAVQGLPWGPSALSAFPKLSEAAAALLAAHGDAITADYPRLVRWCLEVPFYGFDMLPKSPGSPKECWFDGEFAGSVLAPASKLLATPFEILLWETPLCLVWHALAQQAAAYGVKGIERPPDRDTLRRLIAEASAREKAGQLHPWQYEDPVSYGLTAEQFKANPALAPFFRKMCADFEQNGHKPLDPADYPLPDPPRAGEAAGAGACTVVVGGSFRSADGVPHGTAESDDAREASEDRFERGAALKTTHVEGLPSGPSGLSVITITSEYPYV